MCVVGINFFFFDGRTAKKRDTRCVSHWNRPISNSWKFAILIPSVFPHIGSAVLIGLIMQCTLLD